MSVNDQTGQATLDADSDQEDSAVIRALRDEVKSLKADLRDAKTRAETIAESTRNEMRRREEAMKIVNDLGYPKMVDDVVEKVEGDVTAEAVAAFLEARGLEPKSTGGSDADSRTGRSGDSAGALASTANLGQRLADAASGAGPTGLIDRVKSDLDAAQTPQEIAAAMAKAGLTHSR